MISGTTTLIAHVGYPTHSFKSPLIYNPWFEKNGIDAVVVPMGVKAEEYPEFFRYLFKMTNIRGALITMPHKVTTTRLVDEVNAHRADRRCRQCGAAARRRDAARRPVRRGRVRPRSRTQGLPAGRQTSARGRQRRSRIGHRRVARRSGRLGPRPVRSPKEASEALAARIDEHYPQIRIDTGSSDPQGYDIVVNATPLGMNDGDPLPMDVDRISPDTFVGEVVMKQQITPFLQAVKDKGCQIQVGTDMLFEQIPAYLEFFGFGTTTPEELRAVSPIKG